MEQTDDRPVHSPTWKREQMPSMRGRSKFGRQVPIVQMDLLASTSSYHVSWGETFQNATFSNSGVQPSWLVQVERDLATDGNNRQEWHV